MENTRGKYRLNEIFVSPQGEGVRAGTLNHFVRFSGCNMKCDVEPGPLSPGGFSCDSEFESGRWWTAEDILNELVTLNPKCKNIIFTGGEPLLQLDRELVGLLKDHGYYLAIETNGSKELPPGVNYDPTGKEPNRLDWITCSPKVAEHAVRLKQASEVKYVRGYGQAVPRPTCQAEHQLISPAFDGTHLDQRAMAWCLGLIREHPEWRLSVQLHKSWMVR